MSAPERRAQPRYLSSVVRPVSLEWLVDGSPVSASAWVRNASLRGVLALTEVRPPAAGARVKLRLPETPIAEQAVKAHVVDAPSRRPWDWLRRTGPWEVRLKFDRLCPYEVFRALLEGFLEEPAPVAPWLPGEYNSRDWR